MYNNKLSIPAVILAGGQSQRLQLNGQAKWQLPFGQSTLLEFVARRIGEQTDQMVLNLPLGCTLPQHSLPVIYDSPTTIAGPLAGLLTALRWAHKHQLPLVATLPCDTPFFPDDLLLRLHRAQVVDKGTIAEYQDRWHPVFGLWPTTLLPAIDTYLSNCGNYSLHRFCREFAVTAKFPTAESDPFFNINTPDDYQQAQTIRESLWPN